MTNSEFSNFFETFYLREVKQSEQSEVRMSQSGLMALRRAELEHTGPQAAQSYPVLLIYYVISLYK